MSETTTSGRGHPHQTVFCCAYSTERRARVVADALEPEVGEIDDPRTSTRVDRTGAEVYIRLTASDYVALRAGNNSWLRLLEVAESVTGE